MLQRNLRCRAGCEVVPKLCLSLMLFYPLSPDSATSTASAPAAPDFVTYPCPECQAEYYVGQHICFVCEHRLRPRSSHTDAARRAMNRSRYSVLRNISRFVYRIFSLRTSRPGKVIKSPEAEALQKARNHHSWILPSPQRSYRCGSSCKSLILAWCWKFDA